MDSIYAFIMGVVEGLTEFLPISSTGHLILTQYWLNLESKWGKGFVDGYVVIIQLGAILAIVAAYPQRFLDLLNFRKKSGFSGIRGICLLAITSIPVGLLGLIAEKRIEEKLFGPVTVAIALAVGAVWILTIEWFYPKGQKQGVDSLTWKDALYIGLFQCFALWPGMSRSGSTILGGMMTGLERKTATEYSFFAAVPIMIVVTLYKFIKIYHLINSSNFAVIAIGFVISFVFAWLAVKFFISFLSRHTLVPFAWYRLIVAGLVLWLIVMG